MIASTREKAEIGAVYEVIMRDGDCNLHFLGIQILREATREEYLEYCKENSSRTPIPDNGDIFYYKVSTD